MLCYANKTLRGFLAVAACLALAGSASASVEGNSYDVVVTQFVGQTESEDVVTFDSEGAITIESDEEFAGEYTETDYEVVALFNGAAPVVTFGDFTIVELEITGVESEGTIQGVMFLNIFQFTLPYASFNGTLVVVP